MKGSEGDARFWEQRGTPGKATCVARGQTGGGVSGAEQGRGHWSQRSGTGWRVLEAATRPTLSTCCQVTLPRGESQVVESLSWSANLEPELTLPCLFLPVGPLLPPGHTAYTCTC